MDYTDKTREDLIVELEELQQKYHSLKDNYDSDIADRIATEQILLEREQQLKESNQMLEMVIETIPVRIFWKDINSKYLGCNTLFAQDAGMKSPSDVIGKDDHMLSWGPISHILRKDDLEIMNSGKSKIAYEEHNMETSENDSWVSTTKVPLRNIDKQIIGVLGSYEDITVRKKAEEGLSKSEERFKTLSSIASEGIMIHEDGVIIDVNMALVKLFGFSSPDDIIGRRSTDVVQLTVESREWVLKHLKSNVDESYVVEVIQANGTILPIEVRAKNIYYQARHARLVYLTDITERRKNEKELKNSEEKYRYLLENMNEVIMMVDNDDRVLFVNKKFTEILGYKPEEIIGKIGYEQLLEPENHLIIIDANKKRTKKIVSQYELPFKGKNGQIIHFLINGAPMIDSKGKIIGSIGAMTDITERKKAEIALKESEERYKKLIEAFPDSILVTDLKSNIIFGNDPFKKITGITQKDYNNPNRVAHIHPDDQYKVKAAIQELLSSNHSHTDLIENRFIDSWGKLHWLSGRIAKLKLNGEIVLQTITSDITEKKLIELELEDHKNNLEKLVKERTEEIETLNEELISANEELFQNNEELYSVNETLAAQKRQLEEAMDNLKIAQLQLLQSEKMASIGVLTAGIAHEINNPVNFISSGITGLEIVINDIFGILREFTAHCEEIPNCQRKDILQKLELKYNLSGFKGDISKLLSAIHIGIERTTNIVRSLRTFSRMDTENKSIHNIHELIDSSITILNNKLKDQITVIKDYRLNEFINCYPGKLSQVILNLLINAIQAIQDKGEITIITQKSDNKGQMELIIRDTGKGISREEQKKIFDPFFTTKPIGEGTGMGLSIVHGIIKDHNGEIIVKSELGKGTEFRILLPIT